MPLCSCFETYRKDKRRPVFNHWELVLKLASDMSKADDCDVLTAGHLLVQLGHLRTEEGVAREGRDWEQVDLGELGDDDRVCRVCNSTCYTSVRKCACAKPFLCARHLAATAEEEAAEVASSCTCDEETEVHYQASFELALVDNLIAKLQIKAKAFDTWLRACPQAIPIATALEHPQLVQEDSTTFSLAKAVLTTLGSELPLDPKRLWLPVATTEPAQLADDASQDTLDPAMSLGDAVEALKGSVPEESVRLAKVNADRDLQAWLGQAAADWRWDPSSLMAAKTLRHVEALDNEVKEFVRLAGVHRTTLRSVQKDKVDHEGNRAQFVQLLQRATKLPTIATLPELLELGDRCLEAAKRCHRIINKSHEFSYEDVQAQLKSFERLPTCMRPVEDSLRDVLSALEWVHKAKTAMAETPPNHERLEKLAERCNKVVASDYQALAVTTLGQLVEAVVQSRAEQEIVKACLHGETSYDTAMSLRPGLRFSSKPLLKLDALIAEADAWFDKVAEVTEQGDLKVQTVMLQLCPATDYTKFLKLLKQGEGLKLSVDTFLKRMRRVLNPVEVWLKKTCKLFGIKETDDLLAALEPGSNEPDWKAIEGKRAASAKHAAKKNAKFCKCREPEKGNMISCNVCEAWFHCRCLSIAARDAPYMRLVCKECLPCRKPTMTQCQELMNRMGTLPVQVVEAGLVARIIMKANEWMQSAAAVIAAPSSKTAEEVERMCTQADLLPIELSTLLLLWLRDCLLTAMMLWLAKEVNRLAQKSGLEEELPPQKEAKRTPVRLD